jgi:hypothetical protein
MGTEDDILALITLIYEASFDSTLWPTALINLADTTGTTQVSVAAMDRRAQTYDSISPRTDPVMRASYKNYWAFHNPFRPRRRGRCSVLAAGSPSKRIDRHLHAQGARAKRFRRSNFDSSRPAPSTPACDGDAVAVKGHRCGTSLARLEHTRGHCHRRRSGQ